MNRYLFNYVNNHLKIVVLRCDMINCFISFSEPPKGPNDLCPRLNGFYAHPDPAVCNIFYACVEGVAEEYTCSPGLWFDEYRGVCNWPTETERSSCKAGKYIVTFGLQ